ncbi:hypothetical protein O3P69_009085 [Scylla paramamosain]|uniref:Uncharacterized protein n=1 Tax=Scylla paramamosain TaxID=85552 RepID=A0AAW0TTB2_SCYPA
MQPTTTYAKATKVTTLEAAGLNMAGFMCVLHAHLVNADLGSFQATLTESLRLNGLEDVKLPPDPPLAAILKAITGAMGPAPLPNNISQRIAQEKATTTTTPPPSGSPRCSGKEEKGLSHTTTTEDEEDGNNTQWARHGLSELQQLCEKTPVCPTVVIGVLVTSYPEMTLPGWSGVGWGLSGVVLTWSPSLLVLAKTESMKHGRRRSGTIRRKYSPECCSSAYEEDFVRLRHGMWKRAVWLEGKKEEEGVVPSSWVLEENQTLFWPQGVNAENALHNQQEPDPASWRKFMLKKDPRVFHVNYVTFAHWVSSIFKSASDTWPGLRR